MDDKEQMIVEELVRKAADSCASRTNDLSIMLQGFPTEELRKNTSIQYERIEELAQKPMYIFGGTTWRAFWDLPSNDEVFENIINFFEDDGPKSFKNIIKMHRGELRWIRAEMVVSYSDKLLENELYPVLLTFSPKSKPEPIVLINYKL